MNSEMLKWVIEGTRDDDSAQIPLKTLKLERFGRMHSLPINDSSYYNELLKVGNHARQYHLDLNALDPAYPRMYEEFSSFYQAAELMNDIYCLGKHDHQTWVDLVVTCVIDEATVSTDCRIYVNKTHVNHKGEVEPAAIISYLTRQLAKHSLTSYRLRSKIDYLVIDQQPEPMSEMMRNRQNQ